MEAYINYILGALFWLFVLVLAVKYKSYILKQAQGALEYIQSEDFREYVHGLMAQAERELATPTGQARLEAVCEMAINHLPAFMRKFISTDVMVAIINDLFKKYAVTENGHSIVK